MKREREKQLQMENQKIQSVVYTNKAKCRDCYRCVRVCPVNAIAMENGQARVIDEKCISCGTCIPECPQNAKTYIKQIDEVIEFLNSNIQVIISMAPSFASVYTITEQKKLPDALKKAGFFHVSETAAGAFETAVKTRKLIENEPEKAHICSACPAVVNYIEKYHPQAVKHITPVVSPMIAHARMLKKQFGNQCKVVFAGPCVAKKDEARRQYYSGDIDAVLTFKELNDLLERKKIKLSECSDSQFDDKVGGYAKLYPLESGLLKTAGIEMDLYGGKVFALSGYEDIKDAIETIISTNEKFILEPLFCRSGCINAPVLRQKNILQKKQEIIDYQQQKPIETIEPAWQDILDAGYFVKTQIQDWSFDEAKIMEVLKSTGKYNDNDHLNCGACGYNTCKDKAIAVLNGYAEREMCIPYMRRLAENKASRLVEADPNGILILNQNLEITGMNPAFKLMFNCNEDLEGKKLSYLIDPEPFEKLITKKENKNVQVVDYSSYNSICQLICYKMEEENLLVGIFVDITDTLHNKERLRDMKTETIIQAQELIDHQLKMAQELARFIGENTARGEMLMKNLINEIQK